MELHSKTCTNEACSLALDGKCVEGYPLDECPHVSPISLDDIQEPDDSEDVKVDEVRVINLSLGEALDGRAASALQRQRLSRTVGIVGPNEAGKTSLVASVYDLLQEGKIGDFGFAGSSTLIGFEKICHDARVSSRRGKPHTERTSAGADVTFFHLDLCSRAGEIVSLFIGDRSGEDYLAAADDLANAEAFYELRRADVVTVLVNGEHLVSSEQRHEAVAATQQIVEALVEASAFRKGCCLAIVLTKEDIVVASKDSARVDRDFQALLDAIKERHSSHFGRIEQFIVAASPQDSTKVKRGNGVDQLSRFWLEASILPNPIPRSMPQSSRMIDLLGSTDETIT